MYEGYQLAPDFALCSGCENIKDQYEFTMAHKELRAMGDYHGYVLCSGCVERAKETAPQRMFHGLEIDIRSKSLELANDYVCEISPPLYPFSDRDAACWTLVANRKDVESLAKANEAHKLKYKIQERGETLREISDALQEPR